MSPEDTLRIAAFHEARKRYEKEHEQRLHYAARVYAKYKLGDVVQCAQTSQQEGLQERRIIDICCVQFHGTSIGYKLAASKRYRVGIDYAEESWITGLVEKKK